MGIFWRRDGICLHSEVTRRFAAVVGVGSQGFHSTSLEVCRLTATIVELLKGMCIQPLEVHEHGV